MRISAIAMERYSKLKSVFQKEIDEKVVRSNTDSKIHENTLLIELLLMKVAELECKIEGKY